MIHNYHQLAERISKASGKSQEEIDRLVEAKRAKLSGLISREGASQIVASELGLNLDKEKIKINELVPGIKKVNILGKIIRLFPTKEYKTESREGKIRSFIFADDTGNARVVLWDINHISLFDSGQIVEGDFIEIAGANLRNNEIHLSGFSDIKKSSEVIENIKEQADYIERNISEFSLGGRFKTRAFIAQLFEPRFFEVCPQCGKKAVIDSTGGKCNEHGSISPERRALINVVIDDGSANIRAVAFSEQIEKLGIAKEDLEAENFVKKRNQLLGAEMLFSGIIRQNKLFNNPEMTISGVESLDIDKLIESLEK